VRSVTLLVSQSPKSRKCSWRSLPLRPLFAHAQIRSCPFPESAAGDRCSLFIFNQYGPQKDAIWQNFGEIEAVAEGSQSKTKYVPCSACNVKVIASAGRLRDRCSTFAYTGLTWYKTMVHLVLNNINTPISSKTVLNRTIAPTRPCPLKERPAQPVLSRVGLPSPTTRPRSHVIIVASICRVVG
jgi:hypothetical protein